VRACVWLSCSILLWPLQASAQPSVSWSAPADCPSAAQARNEITQLLGRRLTTIEVALAANVRVDHTADDEFRATISIRSSSTTRERVLTDVDCSVLTRATAVVVALAIDPTARSAVMDPVPTARPAAAAGRPIAHDRGHANTVAADPDSPASTILRAPDAETSPASVPTAAPDRAVVRAPAAAVEAAPVRSAETAQPTAAESSARPPHADAPPNSAEQDRTVPREQSEISVNFAVSTGIEFGVLPGVAPTFGASTGLLAANWLASLRIGYAPAQHATLEEPAGLGGRVALAHAAVEGGLRLRWTPLEVPLVVGLETGWFTAAGEGQAVSETQAKSAAWLATYLGSGLCVAWGSSFALGLRVEGLIALRRPSFALESTADPTVKPVFYRPAALGGRAFLEFEVRLR
jgi:hypothetical protein